MGWLIVRKHKDVMVRGGSVDMSDLKEDGVVMFQKKYYIILMPLCAFILPTVIPWYFWNEDLLTSWYLCMLRYAWSLHSTWLVNSAAHIYGMKPYDKHMSPTENKLVSALAIGEGWHNYHHVFPWDYKAGEFGFSRYNITAGTIVLFSKIGWAWDLKTVSDDMIRRRALRTGDGSKVFENVAESICHTEDPQDTLWGWGDQDMSSEAVQCVREFNKLRDD
ncbi:acyl-coa desaturase [Holotrichia oblita]|nr:acyl-coa desaturase [Holotrichia oblita]